MTTERQLRNRLGGVQTPDMQGDNLAVLLCSWFERIDPDDSEQTDSGWTEFVEAAYNRALDAIHAHYAPALAAAEARAEAAEAKSARTAVLLAAQYLATEKAEAEVAALRAKLEAVRAALTPFACKCTGRCERMEWLPADNGQCARRAAALALLDAPKTEGE